MISICLKCPLKMIKSMHYLKQMNLAILKTIWRHSVLLFLTLKHLSISISLWHTLITFKCLLYLNKYYVWFNISLFVNRSLHRVNQLIPVARRDKPIFRPWLEGTSSHCKNANWWNGMAFEISKNVSWRWCELFKKMSWNVIEFCELKWLIKLCILYLIFI